MQPHLETEPVSLGGCGQESHSAPRVLLGLSSSSLPKLSEQEPLMPPHSCLEPAPAPASSPTPSAPICSWSEPGKLASARLEGGTQGLCHRKTTRASPPATQPHVPSYRMESRGSDQGSRGGHPLARRVVEESPWPWAPRLPLIALQPSSCSGGGTWASQ